MSDWLVRRWARDLRDPGSTPKRTTKPFLAEGLISTSKKPRGRPHREVGAPNTRFKGRLWQPAELVSAGLGQF